MYFSIRSPILVLPILVFLAISISVTSSPNEKSPTLPLPNHVLYQFPNPTWVENLAVRANGGILVTLSTTPDLYLIDPSQSNATLVHSFPSVAGLHGIAELKHDMFYIAAGNTSAATLVNTPKSYSLWEVDMRPFSHSSGAVVRKVTDIPEAAWLNGVAALSDSTILCADSILGVVWKVDVRNGSYSIAISNPTMAVNATATVRIGINGIKVRDGHLYFSSTNQGIVCRVPISTSGNATGAVDVLAKGLTPDDFTLDKQGRAWIAENPSNEVSLLLGNGTVLTVVGETDQLTVAGVTSCAFGRDRGGKEKGDTIIMLYCSTSGGLGGPVNGTVVEGGKVVIIDTEAFDAPQRSSNSLRAGQIET